VLDVRTWRRSPTTTDPIALSVDLLEEDRSLAVAMRRLQSDPALKHQIASAGQLHWAANHTLAAMAADYQRAIQRAAGLGLPPAENLPSHFTDAYETPARRIIGRFGVDVDVLRSPVTHAPAPPKTAERRGRQDTNHEPS
jgi:hypothetical protein